MPIPPVAERVATIRALMADQLWDNDEAERLMALWGCARRAVDVAAAEASRQIAASGDAAHDRMRIELWLARVEADADELRKRGQHHSAGNLLLNAAKVLAKVGGLERMTVAVAKDEQSLDWEAVLEAARKPRPKAAQS